MKKLICGKFNVGKAKFVYFAEPGKPSLPKAPTSREKEKTLPELRRFGNILHRNLTGKCTDVERDCSKEIIGEYFYKKVTSAIRKLRSALKNLRKNLSASRHTAYETHAKKIITKTVDALKEGVSSYTVVQKEMEGKPGDPLAAFAPAEIDIDEEIGKANQQVEKEARAKESAKGKAKVPQPKTVRARIESEKASPKTPWGHVLNVVEKLTQMARTEKPVTLSDLEKQALDMVFRNGIRTTIWVPQNGKKVAYRLEKDVFGRWIRLHGVGEGRKFYPAVAIRSTKKLPRWNYPTPEKAVQLGLPVKKKVPELVEVAASAPVEIKEEKDPLISMTDNLMANYFINKGKGEDKNNIFSKVFGKSYQLIRDYVDKHKIRGKVYRCTFLGPRSLKVRINNSGQVIFVKPNWEYDKPRKQRYDVFNLSRIAELNTDKPSNEEVV